MTRLHNTACNWYWRIRKVNVGKPIRLLCNHYTNSLDDVIKWNSVVMCYRNVILLLTIKLLQRWSFWFCYTLEIPRIFYKILEKPRNFRQFLDNFSDFWFELYLLNGMLKQYWTMKKIKMSGKFVSPKKWEPWNKHIKSSYEVCWKSSPDPYLIPKQKILNL